MPLASLDGISMACIPVISVVHDAIRIILSFEKFACILTCSTPYLKKRPTFGLL